MSESKHFFQKKIYSDEVSVDKAVWKDFTHYKDYTGNPCIGAYKLILILPLYTLHLLQSESNVTIQLDRKKNGGKKFNSSNNCTDFCSYQYADYNMVMGMLIRCIGKTAIQWKAKKTDDRLSNENYSSAWFGKKFNCPERNKFQRYFR